MLAVPADALRRVIATQPAAQRQDPRRLHGPPGGPADRRRGRRSGWSGSRFSPETARSGSSSPAPASPTSGSTPTVTAGRTAPSRVRCHAVGAAGRDLRRVVLRRPTRAELADHLGLTVGKPPRALLRPRHRGRAARPAWPRRCTARRRGCAPSGVEMVATGGQAGTSSRIENYLGFPTGISGADLTQRALVQAEKFGAHLTSPVPRHVAARGGRAPRRHARPTARRRRARRHRRHRCPLPATGGRTFDGVREQRRLLRRHRARGAPVRRTPGRHRRRRQLRRAGRHVPRRRRKRR